MPEVMSHNARFQLIGETTRRVVERILSVWEQADEGDRKAGAGWYAEQQLMIEGLADVSGRSRELVTAVVSHLSPRTPWKRNVEGARSLLLTGAAPGHIGANVQRALSAMDADDPLATLGGPKTARFARNLLGDRESVTVDVWAVRVAFGDRPDAEQIFKRVGMYEAVEYAYRLAARRAGVDAVTMQATTWVVTRNGRTD